MRRGKLGSDQVQQDILQLLAMKGPLKYTPFIETLEHKGSKGKYAKVTILKNLHMLMTSKLIEKKLDSDRKPEYSITVKGLKRLAQYGTDLVRIALKNMLALQDIPLEIFEKWQAEPRLAAYWTSSNEERLEISRDMYSSYWGDLLKAYREVHNMICKLAYPPEIAKNNDLFLGFTDTGDLYGIHRRELKEHGLLDDTPL